MVSNNTLAGLVVAVIAISLIGTFVNLRGGVVVTGAVPGTTQANLDTSLTISFINSTVAFGGLALNNENNTLGNRPVPFSLQNDGTVNVSLAIRATDLWNTSANPSTNFKYLANTTGEGTCFQNDAGSSNVTWTNMPPSNGGLLAKLRAPAICDTAEIEVSITAPSGEGSGSKTSSVTVTASQS